MTTGNRVLWVLGATSGMGLACARQAARSGYAVALSGRRKQQLNDIVFELREEGYKALAVPCDVTDRDAILKARIQVEEDLGPISDVVFSAGYNVPDRHWDGFDLEGYRTVIEVNLNSVVEAVNLLLPGMRERGFGSMVFISSWAAWRFSPGAGVAYAASKNALASVAETINAQENRHGIRACHLCPGDVATDFLDQRPVVPDDSERARMLTPDEVAESCLFVLNQPAGVAINELVVTPVGFSPYR